VWCRRTDELVDGLNASQSRDYCRDHHWREYLQMKEMKSREGLLEKAEEETERRRRKNETMEQKYVSCSNSIIKS